jgi:hypothetical protein
MEPSSILIGIGVFSRKKSNRYFALTVLARVRFLGAHATHPNERDTMHGTILCTDIPNLYIALEKMGIDLERVRLSDPFPTLEDWAIEQTRWNLR